MKPTDKLKGVKRLTPEQVREIRRRYATGEESHATIGKDYGLTFASVRNIVNRQTYKWVD